MFITFLIFSVVAISCFVYLAMKGYETFAGLTFVAAVILLFTTICIHFNTVAVGKIETLKSVGIEPLSSSQVYEMSRKELDKCMSIYTFDGMKYFIVEEK